MVASCLPTSWSSAFLWKELTNVAWLYLRSPRFWSFHPSRVTRVPRGESPQQCVAKKILGGKQDFCNMGLIIVLASWSCYGNKLKAVSAWCRSKLSRNVSYDYFIKSLSSSSSSWLSASLCFRDAMKTKLENICKTPSPVSDYIVGV